MSLDPRARRPLVHPSVAGTALAVLSVAAVVVLGLVAAESSVALAIVLLDGTVAWAVLAGAALACGWVVRWIGLGGEPWPTRLVLGAGIGVGGLALMVLGLGSAGWLSKPAAWVLALVLMLAGLARLALDAREARTARPGQSEPRAEARGPLPRNADRHAAPSGPDPSLPASHCELRRTGPLRALNNTSRNHEQIAASHRWLWLLVGPFLAIALLAACLPPGVLWAEEGFGYDVLEYHLAVPKIWHDAGRITFLPHNVYSNFPMNAEMLWLLMMTLRGDAIEAAYMAQLANVAQACLFVAAAWLAGRRFSRTAGVTAGILAATAPWLAYLSGIAYVEPGMLAMGMCSLAALLRMNAGGKRDRAWLVVAGLLAGLACGYKYTAIALIAGPLAAMILVAPSGVPKRIRNLIVYSLAAAAAFSPWMIRNTVNTHNPIFPLAWSVFGAKDGLWDAELDARWHRAHGGASAEHTETPAAIRALQRTVGDERMGYLVFILALAGAVIARDRNTVGLVTMLVLQACVWLAATHLFARFAAVLLMPLVILAGRAAESLKQRPWASVVGVLIVLGAGWNLYRLSMLYYHHTRAGPNVEPIRAYGQTRWFVEGSWPGTEHVGAINKLGPDTRVMLVGEARTFYLRRPCVYAVAFNHHLLAQAVRRNPDAAAVIDWLRQGGVTHLLAHWGEIRRLGSTYGLDPEIGPALFERLTAAGLKPSAEFRYLEGATPYATLFEVPSK